MYNQLSIKLVRYYNCIHQWTVFWVVQTMYIYIYIYILLVVLYPSLEWIQDMYTKMEQKQRSLSFAPFSVFKIDKT